MTLFSSATPLPLAFIICLNSCTQQLDKSADSAVKNCSKRLLCHTVSIPPEYMRPLLVFGVF